MGSSEDSEVLRHVWHSYIPLCFSLAHNEVHQLEEPPPFYAMASRLSYFPLIMDKVVKHFSKEQTKDLWIDFDAIPLKWHYPIGVLFDCLTPSNSLPWQLTVHFKEFPDERLVRCGSRAAIESLFMSAVKEADALKHRSQVMSQLQKKDHLQLWSGVTSDKFDQFWAINRKLMDKTDLKYIPFRLYSQDMTKQRQRLIKPLKEDSKETTFEDLCRLMSEEEDEDYSKYRWITHGVDIPMETPLLWMSQHLSYADNFLHICRHLKS